MAQAFFRQKKSLLTIVSFGFFFSFLLFPLGVSSQRAGSFSVSPLFSEIEIGDESEKTFFLDVTNDTADPVVFRLSFVDFGSLDESGGIAFLGKGSDFQQQYGLSSWMSAEKDVVTVFPQEKESVRITITNKESLSPGGHYGAVLFRIEKEGEGMDNIDSNVSISPNFTALVFVRKSGGEITNFQYLESIIRKDIFSIPDKVNLRFQNSGNTHVTPRGRIEVRDMLGKTVRKGILNEESGRMLPESYRVYPVSLKSLEKAMLPGYYTVSVQYRYDGQEEFSVLPEQRFFSWGVSFFWGIAFLIFLNGIVYLRQALRKS